MGILADRWKETWVVSDQHAGGGLAMNRQELLAALEEYLAAAGGGVPSAAATYTGNVARLCFQERSSAIVDVPTT